jgi:ACS family hexuronate transporter-like MFS transporter
MPLNTEKSLSRDVVGNYRWTICALIFFATTVNYLDRQVISILKPILGKDLGISESDYGYIVMAFQFSYAVGMLLAGRLIDRIGTRIGYAMSLIFWSLSAMLHALATGPIGFGIFRSFLGISEAGNFPAANKAVAEWFPKKERALAIGIFNSGTNVGAIIAPIVVPWLAMNWGWQSAFLIVGAIGLIWLVFWFRFYEIPEKQKRLRQKELDYIRSDKEQESHDSISWVHLLHYHQTWAIAVGKFLTDPIWWFYLFWIPSWLAGKVHGLNVMTFGLPLVVIYTSTTIGSIFGGGLSSLMVARGISVNRSRNLSMLLFACLVIPIIFVQNKNIGLWGAIGLISLAASSHQAWSANIYTTVSDMFPKKAVASVTGIGGMAGALGGTLIAVFAGNLLEFWQTRGHIETGYTILFLICGSAYIIAWLLFNLLAPKMKPVSL